jgi:hypothetical protein
VTQPGTRSNGTRTSLDGPGEDSGSGLAVAGKQLVHERIGLGVGPEG